MSSAKAPTWFQVARRPRWIGALAIALAVAAICALLAQWQLGRSVEAPLHDASANRVAAAHAPRLDQVIQAGRTPPFDAVGTMVKANLLFQTGQAWVVSGRVQNDGTPGYWVVANSHAFGKNLIVTLGFTPDRETALAARDTFAAQKHHRFMDLAGRLAPSEAPLEIKGPVLHSLSLGQLVNLISPDQPTGAYPLFLLVTKHQVAGLEDITVATLNQTQINWLSAFYAIEWTMFCGFSVFLWWRLVRDAQIRETEEGTLSQG
jgi:surfeit locus 1 family protein